jgi:hypothetical protein
MKYARPRMMCKKIPREGKDISTFNEAEISRLQGWQKKMRLEALRKERKKKSRDSAVFFENKFSFQLILPEVSQAQESFCHLR